MKKSTTIITALILLFALSAGGYFLSQQNSNEAMMQKDDSIMENNSDKTMEKTDAMKKVEIMEKTDQTSHSDDSMMKEESKMDAEVEKEKSSMTDDKMKTSGYVDFTPDVLAKTADTKRVLFFYASWCPTCASSDTDFKKNQDKIPDDVTVIRVNYNDPQTDEDEKALAQKYGVTYQHTFVQIDTNDKQVAKWNGGQLNELLSNIK